MIQDRKWIQMKERVYLVRRYIFEF